MVESINRLALQNRILQVLLVLVLLSIPLKNSIYQVSYGLFALFFLVVLVRSGDYRILREHILFLVLFSIILLSMAVSNYFGLEGDEQWELLLKFLFRYIILFFAVMFLLKGRVISSEFVLWVMVASFSVQAIDGIYQQYTGFDFFLNRPLYGMKVLTAATYNRNVLGFILFINSAVLTYFFLNSFQKRTGILYKALICLLLGVSVYALLHSGSRSSWVALASFIIPFFLVNHKILGKKSYISMAVILVVAVWYIRHDEYLYSQVSLLFDSPVRQEIWKFTIEKFFLSPVIGYGLNSYSALDGPHVGMPHNLVMELLLFVGIIGLALFSILFVSVVKAGFRVLGYDRLYGSFMLFLFASVLVEYMFDHSITDAKITNTVLFTIMAVIVSAGENAGRLESNIE